MHDKLEDIREVAKPEKVKKKLNMVAKCKGVQMDFFRTGLWVLIYVIDNLTLRQQIYEY